MPDPPSWMSPPTDLHEKQEPKQIKVKLLGGTYFQMSPFGIRNNKEYFVHNIAVSHLIEQKGTEQDVKKAFEVLVEVRREMRPLLEFPDNKMESKKEECKKKLLEFKKNFKTKCNFAVAEALILCNNNILLPTKNLLSCVTKMCIKLLCV